MRAPVLTLWKGVDAEMVVLDDIVQEAYSQKLRDQRTAYRQQPFNFLRGLSGPIKAKILACAGKVPVITGEIPHPRY